jgi:hypothetical protein
MSHQQCDCPDCCQEQQSGNPLGWIVLTPHITLNATAEAIHAIPDNDTAKHLLDEDGQCACHPWIDDEADSLVYVHQAFDGREDYARGLRRLN